MNRTVTLFLMLALCFVAPCWGQSTAPARPTIGLALEGGGALGLAHVGLIEWFEEHHIPIDYIAGTSMGGLVGGFYASGMTGPEMRRRVDRLDWNQLVTGQLDDKSLAFRRKEDDRTLGNTIVMGLRHGLALPTRLNSGEALDLLLSDVALPYGECVATDLVSAKQMVFTGGMLGQALRATMSTPGFFDPVLKSVGGKDTHEYVDGGLLNNLPVDLVRAMGTDIVIAVYLATDPYDPNKPHSALDVLSYPTADATTDRIRPRGLRKESAEPGCSRRIPSHRRNIHQATHHDHRTSDQADSSGTQGRYLPLLC